MTPKLAGKSFWKVYLSAPSRVRSTIVDRLQARREQLFALLLKSPRSSVIVDQNHNWRWNGWRLLWCLGDPSKNSDTCCMLLTAVTCLPNRSKSKPFRRNGGCVIRYCQGGVPLEFVIDVNSVVLA